MISQQVINLIILNLIILILITYLPDPHQREHFESPQIKPPIWLFWETLPGRTMPGYIDLCIQTIRKNCPNFEINLLDHQSLLKVLPDDKKLIEEIRSNQYINLPQKVDIYRYLLLARHGGIWLDADTIVLKDLTPLYQKLDQYDYVGFGCGKHQNQCKTERAGYLHPINGIIISRPNTPLMKCLIQYCMNTIRKLEEPLKHYHKLGRAALHHCLTQITKHNPKYTYYHVPSRCQEYDSKYNKLNKIFQPFNFDDCTTERYIFPLYNTSPGYPDWFKEMSADDLKNLPETHPFGKVIHSAFS